MHHPLHVGVCGAHIENNFSEFFPFRYNVFFIIEMSGSSFETIGEILVSTTNPIKKEQLGKLSKTFSGQCMES